MRLIFAKEFVKISLLFLEKGEEMGIVELILISIGLAMDAFAVSICKGL